MSKWRALSLILVHVAIAAHVAHWLMEGETLGPVEPSEAITFSQSSVISTGLVFFVLAILATLVFGRFFCGWGCHLLAIQDLCLWLLKKVGIRPKQMRSRALLLVPIGAFVYMFLYPALYRLWHGVGFAKPRTAFVVEGFWDTFPPWPIALATLAVSGFAVVYFLGAKGFCTSMCPYGAAFGAVDRIAPGRIRVTSDCEGCGHCTQVCSSNVLVHSEVRDYGMVVDQECMKCLDCVSVCPKGALYFGFGKPALFARPRAGAKLKQASDWWKVNRWRSYDTLEELAMGALFVLAFFTFRGLYNSIPFLFALALAGLFAYLTTQAARLAYKRKVALQGFTLKELGALTTAGRVYCGFAVVMLALWGQSAYVHYHREAAEAGYLELNDLISGWLNEPRELSEDETRVATRALEHTRIAEDLTPFVLFPREEWELSLTRGWLSLILGDEETFEKLLLRAAEALPANHIAANGLANYYAAAGQVDQALGWFERAAMATPKDVHTWRAWSRYLISIEAVEDARAVLQRATVVDGAPAAAFLELGRFELWQGALPEAVAAFERVLELDGSVIEAHLQLAGVQLELGELQPSVEHYEAATKALPEDFELRLSATLANTRLGDLQRAAQHAEAARLLQPGRPEPYVALSQLAAARGDQQEAQRLYQEAERRALNLPPQ
jgi:polyferredoxin/Tfp pilus assembly protein PilF